MNIILAEWVTTYGGKVSLTSTHVHEDYMAVRASWTHNDFISKRNSPLMLENYTEATMLAIVAKIRELNDLDSG